MEFLRFLRSRIPDLLVFAGALACAVWVLRTGGTPPDLAALVAGILVLAEVVRLVAAYVSDAAFWRRLGRIGRAPVDGDPDPVALAWGLPAASGPLARTAEEAVEALLEQGSANLARLRADSAEYRTFIEGWSHEVKTPLAAASLIVQANPGPVASRVAPELQRIEDHVDQALFFARSYTVDRDYVVREVSLGEMVRDAVRARAGLIQGAGVAVSFDGLDQTVCCDPKWCGFVLGQLIDNACKYPAPGRDPELRFSARRLAAGKADEHVELAVADNGCGIPAADLPRVWDKGFVGANGRDRARGTSTGIGLFLVRDLCQKMGLAVSVWSDGETGTQVSLVFPMVRREKG